MACTYSASFDSSNFATSRISRVTNTVYSTEIYDAYMNDLADALVKIKTALTNDGVDYTQVYLTAIGTTITLTIEGSNTSLESMGHYEGATFYTEYLNSTCYCNQSVSFSFNPATQTGTLNEFYLNGQLFVIAGADLTNPVLTKEAFETAFSTFNEYPVITYDIGAGGSVLLVIHSSLYLTSIEYSVNGSPVLAYVDRTDCSEDASVCDGITCDDGISVLAFLNNNLGYHLVSDRKEPVLRVEALTEVASYMSCVRKEIGVESIIALLMKSDYTIRTVNVTGYTESVDCTSNDMLLTLLKKSLAVTAGGCLALRVVQSEDVDVYSCDTLQPVTNRIRSSFYLNPDGDKAAIGVVAAAVQGNLIICDGQIAMGWEQILSRLFYYINNEGKFLLTIST